MMMMMHPHNKLELFTSCYTHSEQAAALSCCYCNHGVLKYERAYWCMLYLW